MTKRGITENQSVYINRVRLIVYEVGAFLRKKVSKTHPPLFDEPVKFITHGGTFKRLWYKKATE